MKIHIPAFEAMAKGNEYMNHGPLDIDLGPDVVEVVRCKDCQYYQDAKINKKGFLICPASGMEITETDYCIYGARMGKPRICEVLGVEPEERFYYKCEKSQENKYLWKITKEGERMFKEDTDIWRLSSNEKTLMDFINHPDRIIRKPRWTEQELTKKLLDAPDLFFRFNSWSLYSYSVTELVSAGSEMVDRMALRRNEWRGWLNLPPDPEMAELLALENYLPADRLGDQGKLVQGGEQSGA